MRPLMRMRFATLTSAYYIYSIGIDDLTSKWTYGHIEKEPGREAEEKRVARLLHTMNDL